MSTIRPVLSQHAEEAAFHWLLRDGAVDAPHYSLADLVKLDGRLDGHLDGLRIAGDAGWAIVKEELKWEEAGEVFTGLLLAVESADPLRLEEVLAVADQSRELTRGAISALAWLGYEKIKTLVRQLLASESGMRRRIAIGALSADRVDPGPRLAKLVEDADASARARALRAVGELARSDLLHACLANLSDDDMECRYGAAWSGALLRDPAALDALIAILLSGEPCPDGGWELAARRLEPTRALRWSEQLGQVPERLRASVLVAGAAGDPAAVPRLLEAMRIPEVARVAGEAFATITGVDLAFEDLDGDAPDGFEAGPTESPEDEDVAMDPDEDLPWPLPEAVERWWSSNGGRFAPGTRHLCGHPISPEVLADVLRSGMQRQRRAAAVEMASGGQPLFEHRARGDRQRRWLGIHPPWTHRKPPDS